MTWHSMLPISLMCPKGVAVDGQMPEWEDEGMPANTHPDQVLEGLSMMKT